MTDGVFFLKTPAYGKDLQWPEAVNRVILEPPRGATGACGDWRTSTAYGVLAQQLTSAGGGSAVDYLRQKYGIQGRVAFMSYSAGFGFCDRICQNPRDLKQISALLLIDSSFGGGKSGYVSYGEEAARGERLLVASTANTGGDASWAPVWDQIRAYGAREQQVPPRGTMPAPSGGVHQLGKLAWWYRYVDSQGKSELPHWEQHQLAEPMLSSYLIPYWRGELGRRNPWRTVAALGIAAAGGVAAARWI